MRKLFLVLIFTTLSLFAQDLKWIYDFEDAKYFAKKENKIVMMFVTMQSCPVCNYMKEKVFTKKDIKEYLNKHMILYEVDIDMDDLPSGYEVYGTPTTFFIKSDGTNIGKPIIGGTKPEFYIKKLQKYIDQK